MRGLDFSLSSPPSSTLIVLVIIMPATQVGIKGQEKRNMPDKFGSVKSF